MSNKPANEADVLSNRVNVALAERQALMRSWLPQTTNQPISGAKTEEELQKEDEELFKTGPELLGVGIDAPDLDYDSLTRKTTGASMDRLLEQMLGKKAANKHKASSKAPSNQQDMSQQNAQYASKKIEESDDEEEGRASMLASTSSRKKQRPGSKPTKTAKLSTNIEDTISKGPDPEAAAEDSVQASDAALLAQPAQDASISDDEDKKPTKKRGASYLDQLLAEKANKKKKKKQNK